MIKHEINDIGAYTFELRCGGGPCIKELFPGSSQSENKAIYDRKAGILTIPALSINGAAEYSVELVPPFKILSATPK